ncbi:MAG: hypothetical protein RBU37_07220 [Myxococcota bacterium]|jgi:multidrug resistance efflux pump|nr:hypothetical protein [Myxococcota bacterium]
MRALRRRWEELFERLSLRPFTLLVFLLSVLLLLGLQFGAGRGMRAPAVGRASAIEHPSSFEQSVVEAVHVSVGEHVSSGTPLLTLSPLTTQRAIAVLDAQILAQAALLELEQEQFGVQQESDAWRAQRDFLEAVRSEHEAKAEQRELESVVESQRLHVELLRERVEARSARADSLLDAELESARVEASAQRARRVTEAAKQYLEQLELKRPASANAEEASPALLQYHAAIIESLRLQRDALQAELKHTVITARSDGRVSALLGVGASVTMGLSVASVLPEQASEVVAFVDPADLREGLTAGQEARIVTPNAWCEGAFSVLRVGAAVEQAPLQLEGVLRTPVFGVPVYLQPPEHCAVFIGQALTLEFEPTP